jgi:hypothetical protein
LQSTIQSHIQRELLINYGIWTNNRHMALQSQLLFYEVE